MSDLQVGINDCCGETEPTNPKRDLFARQASKHNHLFQLANPIPDEVKDNEDLVTLFNRWNFVPYAGTTSETGHSLLLWYLMLAKLSPTNSAAINKKVGFAVGGKAKAVRSVDPEFETGEEQIPVTTLEAIQYITAIKTFFQFDGGISKFAKHIGWQYESTGNGWVELSFASVMGQDRISLRSHRTTNCLFVNTKPGENRVVAISPVWTDTYLDKNPARLIPVFPVFVNEGGVLRTIFHLKNGDNSWYGRPSSQGSDIYKYREVQDAIYQVRAAATNFTGQLIVEVEDDNPEFAPAIDDKGAINAGNDKFIDQLEKNFTNKGNDPQSMYFASRPYGSKPMFVFQVSPNTKEQWYAVTGKIAEGHILRSHEVTPRFMGFDVSNGFASDVYISDYILNVQPVIQNLHDEIMNFVNAIVTQGWQMVGQVQWNQYSLAFASPIQSTVEDFKKGTMQQQQTQEPAQQSPVDPVPSQQENNPNQNANIDDENNE